jgi:hypothetical protein
MSAVYQGFDAAYAIATSPYTVEFLIGFFATIFFGVLSMTAMIIVFASKKKLTLLTALTSAVHQYIPVLYTSFLAGLVVAISFIPAHLLRYWYLAVQETLPVTGSGLIALDLIVLIAIVALMIPACIVAIWVMYAPLAVALKETPSGMTALMFSKAVVHNHVWSLLWRVIGFVVVFNVLTISFSALPLAGAIVPFILTMLAIAFFVDLYKELRSR